MDAFGIGAALRGALNIYFNSARRTGRTTALLESLKDGDRIVCVAANHQRELQRLCKERNLRVEVILIPTDTPHMLFERGTSEGRTVFDHTWVEQYYAQEVAACARHIDHWQEQSSGYGTAHIRTRLAAIEINKWSK